MRSKDSLLEQRKDLTFWSGLSLLAQNNTITSTFCVKLRPGRIAYNHALPMVAELHFEDIILCLFPETASAIDEAYGYWEKNSVGDVIEMIMQILEGLAIVHNMGIERRDAVTTNFFIQWHPESALGMRVSLSRPRVYLIDFEVAIEFPNECPAEERLTLGASLSNFKTKIDGIGPVLEAMTATDQADRPSAQQALDQIGKIYFSMPLQRFSHCSIEQRDTPR